MAGRNAAQAQRCLEDGLGAAEVAGEVLVEPGFHDDPVALAQRDRAGLSPAAIRRQKSG